MVLAVLAAIVYANFEHQGGLGFSNSWGGTLSYTIGWPQTHCSFSISEQYSTAPGAPEFSVVNSEVIDSRPDLMGACINIATAIVILVSISYCVYEWHSAGASLPFSTLHWWFFAMTTMAILCHSFVDLYGISILISDLAGEEYGFAYFLMEKNWLVDIPISYGLTCVLFAAICIAGKAITKFIEPISAWPAR